MSTPVTGNELKIRAFEAPLRAHLADDHVIPVDGPIGGPGSVAPAILQAEGTIRLPVRAVNDAEISSPFLAMSYGPANNRQVAQFPAADVVAMGGSFYLGPKATPPIVDNFGHPLQPGMTYYNLNDETMYVWQSSGHWAISASALPSAVKVYYYNLPVSGALIPPNGPGTVDSLGNVLSFNTSAGQAAVSGVSMYVNGVLWMNGVDYFVNDSPSGDYITLAESTCANSVVVVQVFSAGSNSSFANSVQLNTASWIFNGVQTTFPLMDMNETPIVPNNATNCMISSNSVILQPNVAFVINADQIIFTDAPEAGDNIWGVIGLPTTGAEGEFGPRVTPFQHGGFGDGATDDSDAVEAAINQVNLSKATLDLAGGTWRLTRQMPTLFYPRVDGGGSGEIYVDYDMALNNVLTCAPVIGDRYTVTAIAVVDYDFEGVFSAISKVTRLTLALTAGQTLPGRGQIGKVTSTNALTGTEAGDNAGQHIVLVAADPVNNYIYSAAGLYDTYTTGVEFQLLNTEQVFLRNFGIRANWDQLVAHDWFGSFVMIMGAVFPKVSDLWIRDGAQGVVLAGCWQAATRGIRVGRMRNATASTPTHVPGYGVVDAGSYQSVHTDLSGSDCRHVYTTISPDAATWPRVAWGRTIMPMVNGGEASSCSAAAYDTHSDCIGAIFFNLIVHGSYFGQNSAGAGIQFRGGQNKAINCTVHGTQVGFEIYKQYAGEYGWHSIEGCTYLGPGVAIRVDHDPALVPGGTAQQIVNFGDFYCETTNSLIVDCFDATVLLVGSVRIVQKGDFSTGNAPRAWEMRGPSALYTRGGLLNYDFTLTTGSLLPRVFSMKSNGQYIDCGLTVISNARPWQAVVSENEATPVAPTLVRIDADVDAPPVSASGTYSQNGAGGIFPPAIMQMIMTTNRGRVSSARTGAFSLNAAMNRQKIVCQGTFTITVPAATILGAEFDVLIVVTSGTVTLAGPGAARPTIAAGNHARIYTVGSLIYNVPAVALGLLT